MQRTLRESRRKLGLATSSRGNDPERTNTSTTHGGNSATSIDPTDSDVPTDGDDAADADDDSDDEEPSESSALPKDVQFDILKNRRRRLVLRYLFEHENPVSLGTLSEHVASIENDKEVRLLDSQERKRAYVGLYQCHLPRMDDADVVDYNKNRGQVALGPNADALEGHLEHDRTRTADRDYTGLYLTCGLFGLGGFLVAQSAAVAGWFGSAVVVAACLAVVALGVWELRTSRDE